MAPAKRLSQLLVLFSLFICNYCDPTPPLILDEGNWTETLTGEWMVKFHAPWCPACKAMKPAWARVATWMEELNIKVATIDVTENPQLSGRFLVLSLPTIYHVKDGEFRTYRGTREESDLFKFIKNKKWQEMEPMGWWRDPNSYQMGALGLFFRASMLIRGVHSTITTDYGIPEWGSYIVFAVATIIAGLMLGLCLVCLCDCIFPPQPPPPLPDWIKEDKDEGDVVEDDTKKEEEGEDKDANTREDEGDADEGTRRRKPAKTE